MRELVDSLVELAPVPLVVVWLVLGCLRVLG